MEERLQDKARPQPSLKTLSLSLAEIMRVEELIENPAAKLHFEANKKGSLYVHITEVKQES